VKSSHLPYGSLHHLAQHHWKRSIICNFAVALNNIYVRVLLSYTNFVLLFPTSLSNISPKYLGWWWRWALLSPDGVAPSQMGGVSASVNLPLHHEEQRFSSGISSPGWSRKKGRKMVVVVGLWLWWYLGCSCPLAVPIMNHLQVWWLWTASSTSFPHCYATSSTGFSFNWLKYRCSQETNTTAVICTARRCAWVGCCSTNPTSTVTCINWISSSTDSGEVVQSQRLQSVHLIWTTLQWTPIPLISEQDDVPGLTAVPLIQPPLSPASTGSVHQPTVEKWVLSQRLQWVHLIWTTCQRATLRVKEGSATHQQPASKNCQTVTILGLKAWQRYKWQRWQCRANIHDEILCFAKVHQIAVGRNSRNSRLIGTCVSYASK